MNKSPRTLKAITLEEGKVMTLRNKLYATDDHDICEHCAYSKPFEQFAQCWVDRSASNSLKKVGICQQITYCAMHQPILAFKRPLVGFEAEFNTLRPGGAWHSRLAKGATVGLMDADSSKLFAKAQVMGVDCGELETMIALYGARNHLLIDDDGRDLNAILRRIYGPQIINNRAKVSVIHLRRLSGVGDTDT